MRNESGEVTVVNRFVKAMVAAQKRLWQLGHLDCPASSLKRPRELASRRRSLVSGSRVSVNPSAFML